MPPIIACFRIIDYTPSVATVVKSIEDLHFNASRLSNKYCPASLFLYTCFYSNNACKEPYQITYNPREQPIASMGPTRILELLPEFISSRLPDEAILNRIKNKEEKCSILIITDTLHDKCREDIVLRNIKYINKIMRICKKLHIIIVKIKVKFDPRINTIGQNCNNFALCLEKYFYDLVAPVTLSQTICSQDRRIIEKEFSNGIFKITLINNYLIR